MYDHADLAALQASSLRMRGWIRRQTCSPENEKLLRRFSAWETAELILGLPLPALRAAREVFAPGLRSIRCRGHVIFHLPEAEGPLVVAVLHERRNLAALDFADRIEGE